MSDGKPRPEPLQPMTLPTLMLMLVTVILLTPLAVRIPYRVVVNYNEGWNGYYAVLAAEGVNFYDAGDALIQNNYPPLSFYIVAAVARMTGDPIVAGRWIAFIGLLWTALNVGLAVHCTSKVRDAALFGALLFLSYMSAHFEDYVGMNDPQMLAHGLMTSALVLLLRFGERPRAWMVVPPLMILAGMVKHSLLAFPLAATAAMALRGRRRFLQWLALCSALAIAALLLVYAFYGPPFFASVLAGREYSSTRIVGALEDHLPILLPLLAVWGVGVVRGPRQLEDRLLGFAVGCSAAVGFFFYGGEGVGFNALFDLLIALCWGAGVGLARLSVPESSGTPSHKLPVWAAALALMLTLLPQVPERVEQSRNLREELARQEAETLADVRYLEKARGPAVCTTLGLCAWAGKSFDYDPFNVWQAVQTGRLNEERILSKIRHRFYAVIQLESITSGSPDDFRTRMLQEVQKHYVLDRQSPYGFFFIPGPSKQTHAG